jgi:SpoVK/Ycf46/Vps4 family AAA+-type ATPase
LRPGRFDKMIYVGLPQTVEEKLKIFQAQTHKLNLNDEIDLKELAKICPEDYSGADIYAVCSLAFTLSLKEKIKLGDYSKELEIKLKHFKEAINKIPPSLPKNEILKYEELRKKYK